MQCSAAPFFSVIIPTYNRAGQLRRALDSVLRQTCADFEVIVCDDGSTDNTPEVVAEYESALALTYLREANWGGPARPRNNGIRIAHGEWLCFLDADDWWYEDKLETMRANTDGSDLLYHDLDVYTAAGRRLCTMKGRQLQPPILEELLSRGNPVIASSVCVRRSVIELAGGFTEDKQLVAVEDFDLWLRIAMQNGRFRYLAGSLGGYSMSNDSISGQTGRFIERHLALLARYEQHVDSAVWPEVTAYWSYCFGIRQCDLKSYGEARELFSRALHSRRPGLVAKSLLRIAASYGAQLVSACGSSAKRPAA